MNSLRGRIKNRQISWNVLVQLQTLIRSSSTASEIKIPNRIERGPTDILRAIKTTISKDPTASHYKYHDDPFLIPSSNYGKRTFALSMESGKKAALWIRQQHADLFQQKLADPVIPLFLPQAVYTDKSQVSEEILLNTINQGLIEDSFHIYELLGCDVKIETKQALLELLCYYNSTEPENSELLEQRWFQNINKDRQVWNDNGEVEKLFTVLKDHKKTAAAAYNALICGLAKYMKTQRAWSLYEECVEKGIPLNTRTYNFLIQLILLKIHNGHERIKYIKNILSEMSKNGVRPNVQTLNACFKVLSVFSEDLLAIDVMRSLFMEFREIGIKPCLTSYYYAIIILNKQAKMANMALNEIVKELKFTEKLEIQDSKDTSFFTIAMNIAKENFNLPLGQRIHNLLLSKDNYKFIGDNFKESIYYRNYTLLLLNTMPIEEFSEIYMKIVPNIYTPEPSVIFEILQTLKYNSPENVREMLPLMWSQVVMFDHIDRQNVTSLLFYLMTDHCALPADSPLKKDYAHVAWSYFTILQERLIRKSKLITLTGETLGKALVLLLRDDQFENMLTMFSTIMKWQNCITGMISLEQLNEIFEGCLTRGHVTAALDTVQYAVDFAYGEAGLMARQIKNTLPLNAKEESRLIGLVGKEILELKLPNEA